MGADDAVFADVDVVTNMAEGIDHGTGANERGTVGGAVDGGVDTDDDAIFDDYIAGMRDAVVMPFGILGEAEPFRAYDTA